MFKLPSVHPLRFLNYTYEILRDRFSFTAVGNNRAINSDVCCAAQPTYMTGLSAETVPAVKSANALRAAETQSEKQTLVGRDHGN